MIKITDELLNILSAEASVSVRKRKNFNFHKQDCDLLQRMLNALEPGTYVRPHKHADPDKREIFILLKGRMAVVEFDDDGNIKDHIILDRRSGNYAAEISDHAWHTVISLGSGSVYYELKDGPYFPATDKIFSDWSPEEGSPEMTAYLEKIIHQVSPDTV
jgi:cupin fold WbuC family metalloprotein